jgi:hypothetical protein
VTSPLPPLAKYPNTFPRCAVLQRSSGSGPQGHPGESGSTNVLLQARRVAASVCAVSSCDGFCGKHTELHLRPVAFAHVLDLLRCIVA